MRGAKRLKQCLNYNFIHHSHAGIRQLERNERILTSGFGINGEKKKMSWMGCSEAQKHVNLIVLIKVPNVLRDV